MHVLIIGTVISSIIFVAVFVGAYLLYEKHQDNKTSTKLLVSFIAGGTFFMLSMAIIFVIHHKIHSKELKEAHIKGRHQSHHQG